MADLNHNWLQGTDVVAVTFRRQTRSGVTLSDAGSDIALATTWENLSPELHDILQETNNGGATRENYIKLKSGFSFSVTYLLTHEGSDPDPLLTALLVGNKYKITYVIGTATGNVVTTTMYAQFESHSQPVQGQGAVRATVTFKCLDVGSGFYTRAIA